MSQLHPVIAVTGSSGAGTSTVRDAFERMFVRANLDAVVIEGDSFHRYDRKGMRKAIKQAEADGHMMSHFGPDANLFERLEQLFKTYSENGIGERRLYLHGQEEAIPYPGRKAGQFTPWQPIPPNTDLLFYEGLHGGLVNGEINIAKYVDLLIGVAPIANLEWMQKIHRDSAERGYSRKDVVETIVRRMPDYANYITPQFSRTDINFQRIPTIDTSNPFEPREIPSLDESYVIIHVRRPSKFKIDFRMLLDMISGSFMSRPDHIVIPGSKMVFAMETIIAPAIEELMNHRHALLNERERPSQRV